MTLCSTLTTKGRFFHSSDCYEPFLLVSVVLCVSLLICNLFISYKLVIICRPYTQQQCNWKIIGQHIEWVHDLGRRGQIAKMTQSQNWHYYSGTTWNFIYLPCFSAPLPETIFFYIDFKILRVASGMLIFYNLKF